MWNKAKCLECTSGFEIVRLCSWTECDNSHWDQAVKMRIFYRVLKHPSWREQCFRTTASPIWYCRNSRNNSLHTQFAAKSHTIHDERRFGMRLTLPYHAKPNSYERSLLARRKIQSQRSLLEKKILAWPWRSSKIDNIHSKVIWCYSRLYSYLLYSAIQ